MIRAIILSCFLLGFLTISQAQKNFHEIFVKGKISNLNGGSISKAFIYVLENEKKTATYYSDNSGYYELTLADGKVFVLEFGKNGIVSKKVEINTSEVTRDELKFGIFPINLDISLFENFTGLDISSLADPIAKMTFSDYEGDFIYDNDYSGVMNKKISKVLEQLKGLKLNAYEKDIAVADEFFKEKKLEYAWMTYQRAQELLPEKQYPKDQINAIKNIISSLLTADEAYNRNLSRADKNYQKKSFKTSLDYYKKSLLYKPEEAYPVTRIDEIEKMLSGNPDLMAILEKEEDVTDIFSEKPAVTTVKKDSVPLVVSQQTNNNVKSTKNNPNITTANNKKQEIKQPIQADSKVNNTKSLTTGTFDTLSNVSGNDKEKIVKLNSLLNQYVKADDFENQARVYESMALLNYRNGEYDKASKMFSQAYESLGKTGDKKNQAIISETLGNINEHLYRYDAAADWYQISADLYGDNVQIPKKSEMLLRNGDMNFAAGKFNQAISNYLQSLSYDIDYDGTKDVSTTYNCIGAVYYEMGKYDEALNYFKKSENMADAKENRKEFAMSLNNIGNVEYEWNKYNTALDHYLKSAEIKTKLNYKAGLAVTLHNIGNVFRKKGDNNNALKYYKLSSNAGEESGNTDVVYANYRLLSEVYASQKNCDRALEYYKLYSACYHLISGNHNRDQISETNSYYRQIFDRDRQLILLKQEVQKQKLLSWYESQRRVKEVAFLSDVIKMKKSQIVEKEAKMTNQRRFIWVSMAGIFLLLLLVFTFWWQRNAKKRANILLAEQNEEINSQKEEIMTQRDDIYAKNREITDSIKYARRIQNAILPSDNNLNQLLHEHFVYFKPRDIVSGDFYWLSSVGDKTIIAVADCTGHGVPGAFMSVMGFSLLGQVVNELSLQTLDFKASDILDKMRLYIIAALHQTGEIGETQDGMDMSLCIYDKANHMVQFAGANTYLYKYGVEEFKLYKGDRMPVSFFRKKENPFTNQLIEVKQGEMIYLATDGITDQFGGKSGKKFRQESFCNLLVEIYKLPLDKQREEIEKTLLKWMGSCNQVDDILVLGWKIE